VPTVGARYWTAISLASIFGCNLGDFVSLYLHWEHWLGLFPLAVIFATLVAGERHSVRTTEAWYWTVVIALRTAATNIADLATHTFAWPLPAGHLRLDGDTSFGHIASSTPDSSVRQ